MAKMILQKDVAGDWICLEFRRSVLRSKFGVVVRDEEAMPVGQKQVNRDTIMSVCLQFYVAHPHVYQLQRSVAIYSSALKDC